MERRGRNPVLDWLLLTSALDFKYGWIALLTCFVACLPRLPQIYLLCDTYRTLVGKHGSRAVNFSATVGLQKGLITSITGFVTRSVASQKRRTKTWGSTVISYNRCDEQKFNVLAAVTVTRCRAALKCANITFYTRSHSDGWQSAKFE